MVEVASTERVCAVAALHLVSLCGRACVAGVRFAQLRRGELTAIDPLAHSNLFLGATQTTWAQGNASQAHHVAVGVALVGVAVFGAVRVQSGKLPKLTSG